MKFTLDAGGAQATGQGLGNIFKAFVLGPQVRQQAEQDGMLSAARLNQAQSSALASGAAAEKNQAEAALKNHQLELQKDPLQSAMLKLGLPTGQADVFRKRLETGSFGPSFEPPVDGIGPTQQAPATPETVAKLGQAISLIQRMYATGSNVEQGADAGLKEQTQDIRDKALSNVGNLDLMNKLNTLAKPGESYMPFDNVGTSGYSLNKATGAQTEANPVISELFRQMEGALVNQRNASASKSSADAQQVRMENNILTTTGAKPGSGREAAEGALSTTILNTLKVPALDAKGKPVRNPITGEQEMTVDLDAQKAFYKWTDANKRKPTATAFSQWEAQGRPGANKNPEPEPVQPTIVQAPPAQERKPNTVYQTPKGPMKWTGTGWLPAN